MLKDRRQKVDHYRLGRIEVGYKHAKKGRIYRSCESESTWQNTGNRLAKGRTLSEVFIACHKERTDLFDDSLLINNKR